MTHALRERLLASADRAAELGGPVPDWLPSVRAGIRARHRRRVGQAGVGLTLAAVVLVAGAWSTLQSPDRRSVVAGTPPAVESAQVAVVQVTGTAPSCARRVSGTGFYVAPHRVMTSAHVVAGTGGDLQVRARDGRSASAVVVWFDSDRDLALLRTDGLDELPLTPGGEAEEGTTAYTVGYPDDGPLLITPVTVRGRQRARGPNIYQQHTVVREVYLLTGPVQPGFSGGPLLAADGRLYGVVLAQQARDRKAGYALTRREVEPVANHALTATAAVSAGRCQ